MTWDSILVALLLLSCVGAGMIIGAWITVRSLHRTMSDAINFPEEETKEED